MSAPATESGQRRITLTGLAAFFCILLFSVWLLQWSDATRKVDRLLHDSWVRYHQRAVPDDVVIAAIDSKSLDALGRWPWPRDVQASLLEQLQRAGVRAVVVDLLYVEPDDQPASDARLAAAIDALPIVILPVLTEGGRGRAVSEALPISDVLRHVTDIGHIFLPIDDDGIVRRVFLKSGFNQAHWPVLPLAALEAIDGKSESLPGRKLEQVGRRGNWTENHEVLIPFYGTNGAFQRIPAVDIIRDTVSDEQLAGKIVFVGLTTTGLGDVVPTPVSALDQPVPGVEIHANIFAALRDGSLVVRARENTSLLVALLLLPFMLLLYSRAPPRWSLAAAVTGACLPVLFSFLMYRYARQWYPPLSVSLPILMSYLLWSWNRLEYVNRFLERERAKLAPHLPKRDSQNNALLAEFFNTASRHLPIQGWRFHAGDDVFSGGSGLPETRVEGSEGGWYIRRGIYTRTYAGPEPLHIEMCITDVQNSSQITDYVDTLGRVRSREKAALLSGSIEKLQTNALNLSEEMDWLRSIKVFSETILDGSPSGFAVWNAAGECIRANQLVYEIVPGFLERADFVDFLESVGRSPTSADDAQRAQQLILKGEPWQVSHSEGERELVVNFNAVGSTLAERLICASVLDVTDIKTVERARAEMIDYLSHDLRSPLISALYLLEQDNDPRIEQNIQQSLTMMDDLLHVARADSLSEAQFKHVLLNAVLDNSLDQMLPQALEREIQFEVDTSDDDLWIDGDAASLERALTNIISNAIKYSSPGTTVSIRLVHDRHWATLTIDDQGVGIDPAMLDQLFTRFKRDTKTAGEFKGIGLGLALVARVVSLHGGSVAASNLPDGTRITLRIPLESAPVIEHDNGHGGTLAQLS